MSATNPKSCLMAGVDMLTVARWVGHSSTDMINNVYGHLRPEHTAEQMRRISFAVGWEGIKQT